MDDDDFIEDLPEYAGVAGDGWTTMEEGDKSMLYVVFDKVAQESGPIFEAKNDGVAIRQFTQLMEKNPIDRQEFALLCLGEIDHGTNEIMPTVPPREILVPLPQYVAGHDMPAFPRIVD